MQSVCIVVGMWWCPLVLPGASLADSRQQFQGLAGSRAVVPGSEQGSATHPT